MKTTRKGTVLLNLWKKGRTRGSMTQVNKFRFYKKCNKECKREKKIIPQYHNRLCLNFCNRGKKGQWHR